MKKSNLVSNINIRLNIDDMNVLQEEASNK